MLQHLALHANQDGCMFMPTLRRQFVHGHVKIGFPKSLRKGTKSYWKHLECRLEQAAQPQLWLIQVGVMHTNYQELALRNAGPMGPLVWTASHVFNQTVCGIHTHKVQSAHSTPDALFISEPLGWLCDYVQRSVTVLCELAKYGNMRVFRLSCKMHFLL